jgi:hypothetical protein
MGPHRRDVVSWALAMVLVLNLLDAVATLMWIEMGVAAEANVLLVDLVDRGAMPFMLVKLTLVSLGVLLLWRQRSRWLARAGAVTVAVVYVGLLAVHVHVARVAVAHALA